MNNSATQTQIRHRSKINIQLVYIFTLFDSIPRGKAMKEGIKKYLHLIYFIALITHKPSNKSVNGNYINKIHDEDSERPGILAEEIYLA